MCLNWLLNYHMLKKCKSKFFCRVKRYNKRPHTLLHNPEYAQDNKDGNVSKANKSIDEKKIRIPIWIAKVISTRIWLKETHFWTVVLISRWLVIGCRKNDLNRESKNKEYYQLSLIIIKSSKWSSYYQNIFSLQYIQQSKADAFVALNITPNKVDITNLKRKQYHFWNSYFPSLQGKGVGILMGILVISYA